MTFSSVLLRENFNVCGGPSDVDWCMLLIQQIFIMHLVYDRLCPRCWGTAVKRDKVLGLVELTFQDFDVGGEKQQTNGDNSI